MDRKALAAQAVRKFNAFNTPKGTSSPRNTRSTGSDFKRRTSATTTRLIPKVLPNEYLTAPKPTHTFVYVSTIQRMARNLFGAEAFRPKRAIRPRRRCGPVDIPIHAFDLIIADECHRGYTAQERSIWRETINTSTPSSRPYRHAGTAHHRSSVRRCFATVSSRPFLTAFWSITTVAIKSEVRMNGVFLKRRAVGKIDTDTGKEERDNSRTNAV